MSSFTLSTEVEKATKQYAEKKGVSIGEAANMLIATGIKRLKAVHKWMDANKKPAKAKPAKKAAKKAKGPIARKAPKKAAKPAAEAAATA